ncbi:MAG TPA: alkaline phosphatase family protein, partial [Anaerolineae bacterium]
GSLSSAYTAEQDGRDFSHREDQFFLNAALNVLRQPDWDMVITYQGIVDGFEHAYLLTDPRQLSYTQSISLTYWDYIKESYQAVDAAIVAISNTVGLTQTDIFVASDHGQAPIHTTLYINRLLAQQGISVTTPITAYAQAGGGYAYIYINATTRSGGVISSIGTQGYTDTQTAIANALSSFTDTDRLTGQTIYPFDVIVRKQDLGAHGLYTDTVGDVFATVRPGYSLSGATNTGAITEAVAYGGTHGHAITNPELYGVFLAAGPEISHTLPQATRLIDVAPTVAGALGLGKMQTAEGVPMCSILSRGCTPTAITLLAWRTTPLSDIHPLLYLIAAGMLISLVPIFGRRRSLKKRSRDAV